MKNPQKIKKKIREEIEKIDAQLINLLESRKELVGEIKKLKEISKEEIYYPEREFLILNKLIKKSSLDREFILQLFRQIISYFRSLQKQLKIGYLGPPGSFSELAVVKFFGKFVKLVSLESIEEIFLKLIKNEIDCGVVPIENSYQGSVIATLDCFLNSDFEKINIIGEIILKIDLYLVSRASNINQLEVVYSHPQALAQAKKWLKENLPQVIYKETSSTSQAYVLAKRSKKRGAIVSEKLAKKGELNILAEKIQDLLNNQTRFLVLSLKKTQPTGFDKTSILVSLKDTPGALWRFLTPFAKNKINLTKIESRPSKKKLGDYLFFIDFEGHQDDPLIKKTINSAKKFTLFFKILGSYPKALEKE